MDNMRGTVVNLRVNGRDGKCGVGREQIKPPREKIWMEWDQRSKITE